MLERVRYEDDGNGVAVEAFTDGYAYDEHSCLYLLSVAGRESCVKAITSAAVSGRTVEIVSDRPAEVTAPYGAHYRILGARLPDGLLHQVLTEQGFFAPAGGPPRLLHVDGGDPARVLYEAVSSGYPVPMIPAWSEWLYRRLREEGHVRELRGSRKVLRLDVDEEALDGLVSEGVRSGEITF